ncbi:MAG: DUF1795 domain-containing protein [bacterium]|nr:DUF1795 domain-containing protein [bacterium]
MKQTLTKCQNKKQGMCRILLSLLLIALLSAVSGCAKEDRSGSGVRDIVPENGIGADGMPTDGTDGSIGTGGAGISGGATDATGGAGIPGGATDATGGAGISGGTTDASGGTGIFSGADGGQETAQVGRLTLTLPAGYQEATTGGLYLNQNYPDDQSNVYIYTTEKTTDFAQVMADGAEQFVRYLADSYEQQYAERPEITLVRYEAADVGGRPAYVVELSYELKEVHYEQLEYIVDADKTYYIAFSQVGTDSWIDAFRVSAGTMFFSEEE